MSFPEGGIALARAAGESLERSSHDEIAGILRDADDEEEAGCETRLAEIELERKAERAAFVARRAKGRRPGRTTPLPTAPTAIACPLL